jgi:hypothetical protein
MTITMSEQIISLSAAAKLLPRLRAGRPVSPATLWRWTTRGVRGVCLETIRIGATTATSAEALDRFIAAINDKPIQSISPSKRERQIEKELAAIGL